MGHVWNLPWKIIAPDTLRHKPSLELIQVLEKKAVSFFARLPSAALLR
jgi:hypothetical protein